MIRFSCPTSFLIIEKLGWREIYAERDTALTNWRGEISRLSILIERAHDFTPAAFVKRLHELLPGLHQTAMEATVYTYATSGRKEE
jgi:hypothetical protein